MLITPDTPLKFTARGGVAYAGRGRWNLPAGDTPGKWMRDYKTKPILCERGYHWCYARHALHHMHAECWLIETRGVTVEDENKNASQGARLLRRVETWNARTARLFAADCADAVVHLCGDDPRPRSAIETARRFAQEEATAEELDAASAAAWAANEAMAARAAASAAARAAASAAGAASAAALAALAADWSAWAAWAAWAASGAARAASDAARAAQTTRLLQYLNGEIP